MDSLPYRSLGKQVSNKISSWILVFVIPVITVSLFQSQGFAVITVKDSGKVIHHDIWRQRFENLSGL